GQSATLESIRTSLSVKFPSMQTPDASVVYDTLAQLMQERKIYQTSRGFFIVTPERRRSRSRSSSRNQHGEDECSSPRTMLMSDQEALHQQYGEITTVRDGAVTHQCVQTNLADVICGGNYSLNTSRSPVDRDHNPADAKLVNKTECGTSLQWPDSMPQYYNIVLTTLRKFM
ncbi:Storkhead-box protein 1, partial [Papilio xuthus]